MNEEGPGCLIILIILAVLYFLFRGAGGICKYEGQTAEEWFNFYDYQLVVNIRLEEKYEELEEEFEELEEKYEIFRSCVEDYDSLNIRDQIYYGGVLNYCY